MLLTHLPAPILFLSLLAFIAPGVIAAEIDFKGLPTCAWSDCFPYHSSAIGCGSLTKNCFCNALAPINCAGKNCTGSGWYEVEDWFNGQCGIPQNVTLQQLPQCSRSCIRQAIMPQFCQAQITKTCFCRLQEFFLGLTRCLVDGCRETPAAADEMLGSFYRQTCIYNPTVDGTGASGASGAAADEVVAAPQPDDKSSPVERVSLIAGLLGSFLGILVFGGTFWAWLSRRRRLVSFFKLSLSCRSKRLAICIAAWLGTNLSLRLEKKHFFLISLTRQRPRHIRHNAS